MSSEGFPKVELNEPADLKHVLDAIKEHALALANAELKADKATTPLELEATRKALDLCIAGMRRKLELNVLVNNMTFDDLATHKTPIEPFDAKLSEKVQSLAEEAEHLTSQVVRARKEVPARKAAAMRARALAETEALRGQDERRREVETQWREMKVEPMKLKLDRADEVQETLRSAKQEIDALQLAMLERTTDARDHTRLVKRLRANPPPS